MEVINWIIIVLSVYCRKMGTQKKLSGAQCMIRSPNDIINKSQTNKLFEMSSTSQCMTQGILHNTRSDHFSELCFLTSLIWSKLTNQGMFWNNSNFKLAFLLVSCMSYYAVITFSFLIQLALAVILLIVLYTFYSQCYTPQATI